MAVLLRQLLEHSSDNNYYTCSNNIIIISPNCKAPHCSEGEVRLVQGITAVDGIVQLCHDEDWGTVCANGWDDSDASVVCRQLGFSARGDCFHNIN